MSNRIWIALAAALLAFGPACAPARAAEDVYRTAVNAQLVREAPIGKALKVEFDGIPGPSEQMRAIFNEEMQLRGYRLDPVSSTVLTIRWRGSFSETDQPSRFQARGKGGSDSRTELGFAITLGVPAANEGEETYSLGASLADGDGEIWKGKVIAVSASRQKTHILRQMTRQLLDVVGGNLSTEPPAGSPPPRSE